MSFDCHIGQHCDCCDCCGRQDYLPFHCGACDKHFCKEHRSQTVHNCVSFTLNILTESEAIQKTANLKKEKKRKKKQAKKCKHCRKSIHPMWKTKMKCEQCKFNYCIECRHDFSHNCEERQLTKKKKKKTAQSHQPSHQPSYSSRQTVIEKQLCDAFGKLDIVDLKL
jgi:hypothetical protein